MDEDDLSRRAILERLCRERELPVGARTDCATSGRETSRASEGRSTNYSARCQALAQLRDWTDEMTGFWGVTTSEIL
ncbi:hypothetical protein [Palleronia marisminoris]|uniref:hypothetical protein n=1 Tax=Palleronia marisminoris TaxID=315423 RepID=UPI001C31240B|nr:hypothetical protein [Palleronia marisminoris]